MRLVHISDLHFGRHDPVVTAGLAAELAAQHPDLVVVSGDLTQRGTPAEFELARRFLQTVAAPVFAVPGNHDLGRNPARRFLAPLGLYRRFISADVEPFRELDWPGGGVALAGLNTTRRAFIDRDWSNGSINALQLSRLDSVFQRATPGTFRIVVAHHPLMTPLVPTLKPTREVRRAALALEAFATLNVRLVLSGHFHLSFLRKYERRAVQEGIPPGPREAAAAPVLVCQASSVISDRLRGEPNAYNVIDIADGRLDIRVRAWQGASWETREEAEVAT